MTEELNTNHRYRADNGHDDASNSRNDGINAPTDSRKDRTLIGTSWWVSWNYLHSNLTMIAFKYDEDQLMNSLWSDSVGARYAMVFFWSPAFCVYIRFQCWAVCGVDDVLAPAMTYLKWLLVSRNASSHVAWSKVILRPDWTSLFNKHYKLLTYSGLHNNPGSYGTSALVLEGHCCTWQVWVLWWGGRAGKWGELSS